VLRSISLLFFFSISVSLTAQKSINVTKVQSAITIDGHLDEPEWQEAEIATGFTQITPNTGKPSQKNTTIKVLYDDDALYIGAYCYDDPKEMSKILCQRDRYNTNTDYISIMIDTYNDKLNGFVFSVSTMGVQYDAKIYAGTYNSKLDMIWYSEVQHTDSGWVAEIKIPYSAIRFAKKDEQLWGINFTRNTSAIREEASWNPVRPDLDNIVTQAGLLKGIKNITPPLRLFFLPFVSGYVQHFPSNVPSKSGWGYDLNGGMDIKYGVNEAFTLDMTLVPDFGQVVSDNFVLNLSPFEVRFDENRPFFTEGTELFEKAGLFYSRRVGGRPINGNNAFSSIQANERLIENPSTTTLINASKFSGRNKNGLGIGVFNGISAPQYATIENTVTGEQRSVETAPLANYNVMVFDQNLKNNSSVTLTNTNVMRSGTTYDANVTGLNTTLNTKDNAYVVAGNAAVSQKYFSDSVALGHNFSVWSGKQTGNFIFGSAYSQMSNTYDPNDLGFLFNNNNQSIYSEVGYNIYKPFWKINRLWSKATFTYNRLYSPNVYTGMFYNISGGVTEKNFHSIGTFVNGSFGPSYDYFEPRTAGYFFKGPTFVAPGFWVSSNYQRVLALDFGATIGATDIDWVDVVYHFSPRLRASDKLFIVYRLDKEYRLNQRGYAIPFMGVSPTTEAIIFGRRDVETTVNTIDLSYTMTNKMGITFRLRHYWSKLDYKEFYELQTDGTLITSDVTGLNPDGSSIYNNNFNAFTIDMVYRWIFSPASELNVVWKNNIFASDDQTDIRYFNNLSSTIVADQLNSFSVRLVYFLDYQVVKKQFKKSS
jgi:hypothetical protein